jgi:hypothetical protein
MAKTARQKRERREASARQRLERKNQAFESRTLRLPEGLELFQVKEACVKRLDVFQYLVKHDNPMADPGYWYYERTYYLHQNLGPNTEWRVCPKRTANKPCPVCEYVSNLRKDYEANKELINDFKTKERQLLLVRDLSEPDGPLKLWDVSTFLFGEKLDELIDGAEDGEYDNFASLTSGMTLRVKFVEKPWNGKTSIQPSTIEIKQRSQQYDADEWTEDKVPCLDDLLIIPTYQELEKLFYQTDTSAESEDDDDDDDDDKPVSKSRAAVDDDDAPAGKAKAPVKKSTPTKPWDDDDDEEEELPAKARAKTAAPKKPVDDDDDDDDFDTLPAAGKKKPAPKKPVVEDDDDDDDDEPAPKPTSKKPAPKKPVVEDDDDDDDEEDDEPRKPFKKSDEECAACEGTGENSKGGRCSACRGTGVPLGPTPAEAKKQAAAKKKDDDDDDEELPVRAKASAAKKAPAKKPAPKKPVVEDDDDDWDEQDD